MPKVKDIEDIRPQLRVDLPKDMAVELRNVISHLQESRPSFIRRHLRIILDSYTEHQRKTFYE